MIDRQIDGHGCNWLLRCPDAASVIQGRVSTMPANFGESLGGVSLAVANLKAASAQGFGVSEAAATP
jgi:hypothetical protein